jgi:hypothetical protein
VADDRRESPKKSGSHIEVMKWIKKKCEKWLMIISATENGWLAA